MRRALLSLVLVLGVANLAFSQEPRGSYLVQHVRQPDGQYISRTVPYEPQPGDLLFFNNHKPHWVVLYKLVGSDAPYHAGLVYRRSNGEFMTAEAGPDDTAWCRVQPLLPRLQNFQGMLHIRRVKTPISDKAERAMEQFAEAQDGKRYAAMRCMLQTTPFRCRGPVRRDLFGATYTDRCSYMCAELAVAGGTIAGLFDPNKHPGNAIYPRDIIANDNFDISATFHDAELWTPYALEEPLRAQFPTGAKFMQAQK